MNRVDIIGRLTHDPEVRYTNGTEPVAVCRISVAVPRAYKKEHQPEADFINCVAFGKTGENIGKYLTKGRKIAVSGRLQTGSYIKNDETRYYTEVVVEGFDFCDSKSGDAATTPQAEEPRQKYYEGKVEKEDLPF